MRIEYDEINRETILHLNADELGRLIFALDMTSTDSYNPVHRREAEKMRSALTSNTQ